MKTPSLKNRIVITIILFTMFYVAFAIYSDVDKIKENFQQIKFIYLMPILAVLTFSMFVRSLLQRFLLNTIEIRLSTKQSFLLFLSGLSMLITPGGAGQIIKSHFIEQNHNHPISKSLPLVFAERFYDFLAIVAIVSITLILFYSLVTLIIITISSILLLGLFLTIRNKKIFHLIQSLSRKIKFLQRIIPQESEFSDSVEKFFSASVIFKGWTLASIAFLLEGFVIYLCFLSFSVDLGYFETFQIYYTSVLFGTISFIPGGVGVLEGSFVKLLILKHFELPLVTTLIIFIRLNTTWYATALGFIATSLNAPKKDSNRNK